MFAHFIFCTTTLVTAILSAPESCDEFLQVISKNQISQIQKIIDSCPQSTSSIDEVGNNALMLASANGDEAIMNLIYKTGIDIYAQNYHGMTALMIACLHAKADAVDLLMNFNSSTDIQDNDGKTALMYACQHGGFDAIRIILSKHSADSYINLRDNSELHRQSTVVSVVGNEVDPVSENGTLETVSTSLCLDIQTTSVLTPDGWTALMYTAQNSDFRAVRLLLRHGADVTIRDNDGRSALGISSLSGTSKTFEFLLDHVDWKDVSEKDWEYIDILSTEPSRKTTNPQSVFNIHPFSTEDNTDMLLEDNNYRHQYRFRDNNHGNNHIHGNHIYRESYPLEGYFFNKGIIWEEMNCETIFLYAAVLFALTAHDLIA
eukprot:gene8389-17295_t